LERDFGYLKTNKKILFIIQARVGSSRLPNKVLLSGYNKSMIEHQIERILFSKYSKNLVLATTTNKKDLVFERLFKKKKISIFRGSKDNVLKRFYDCAKFFQADIIVRFTGDCPLIDYKLIDEAVTYFLKNNFDYINNIDTKFIPDGLHVEIFNFKSLKLAFKKAKTNFDREHVTPYILVNEDLFKIKKIRPNRKYTIKNLRLTLDYIQDYFLINQIYNRLYKKNKKFSIVDIINLIKKNPNYLNFNKQFINLQNSKFKKIRKFI